jgi:hypothetical protein
MKFQFKLFKSLISLVFALFLCVGAGYAWFTINNEANVNSISLTIVGDEGGLIEFDETGGSDNSSRLIPNKAAAYDMISVADLTNIVISVTQTIPTKTQFDNYFLSSSNINLLDCEYNLNYYHENEKVQSYKYDITNKQSSEKSDFLYTFTTNNEISSFMSMQIEVDGDDTIYDLTYDETSRSFSIAHPINEEQKFRVLITFGNDKYPEVSDDTLSNNLGVRYECCNYNCFLLNKINVSFELSN